MVQGMGLVGAASLTIEKHHYPIPQEHAFDPFNLNTIKPFACMESPNHETLEKYDDNPAVLINHIYSL